MLWLHEEIGVRILKRAVAALLVAGFVAYLSRGGSKPDDPSLRPVTGGPPPSTAPTVTELPGEP